MKLPLYYAGMRFCHINIANIYPQDIHLIDGLRSLGHEVVEINETSKGFSKYIHLFCSYKKTDRKFDAVVIGFTCPHFVPLSKIMTTNKVIFNGVLSQYEANVISRGKGKINILRAIKWWLVDFVSFQMSSLVLLESRAQINFINKFFLVPKRNLKLPCTWVD